MRCLLFIRDQFRNQKRKNHGGEEHCTSAKRSRKHAITLLFTNQNNRCRKTSHHRLDRHLTPQLHLCVNRSTFRPAAASDQSRQIHGEIGLLYVTITTSKVPMARHEMYHLGQHQSLRPPPSQPTLGQQSPPPQRHMMMCCLSSILQTSLPNPT